MENKLYIIIPAYNEEDNIESVINEWYPIVEKYNGNGKSKLLIIDDGSKDNTYSIMQKYASKYPLFHPITKKNSGHGSTILHGYQYAIDHDADFVFQTDSDGQTLPNEFHQFWEMRENYDMIIGYRNKREDGVSRVIVTKTLKLVLKICFGVNITDANTPFRLMNIKTLKDNIKYVPKDFNLSNVILSVIYFKRKQRIKYIPISFMPRQGGVNSINLKKIFKIGIQALKDFKEINKKLNIIQ